MVLTSIQLENFKCFNTNQKLDFSKLTIITGANSSGKSSILYGILGALQSKGFPLQYSPNGKYINMGDFKEISYNHNPKNIIKLEYELTDETTPTKYNIITKWKVNIKNQQPELDFLSIKSNFLDMQIDKTKNGYNVKYAYDYSEDPNRNRLLGIQGIMKILAENWDIANIETNQINTPSNEKLEIEQFVSKFFASSSDDFTIDLIENLRNEAVAKGNFRLQSIITLFLDLFKDLEKNTNFISSFRLHPERTSLERNSDHPKIKKFGEDYLEQIVSWEKRDSNKFKELIDIMRSLNLLYSLKTNRLQGGRFEVIVATKKNSIKSPLSDVGFGLSQFLPIIVADLQLPHKSNLLISQPEIHLHPSSQSLFGDYIVSQIREKEKNYVIETHSEYLLNKIRLKIVLGELKEEEIKIYYVENKNKTSTVHEIKFEKNGDISNAPIEFFNTYMMDMSAILTNS